MEVFSTINAAETEARKIRSEAEKDAAAMKERAEQLGKSGVETAIAAAKAAAEGLLRDAANSAAKDAEGLARTTENRKAVLRDRVEKKLGSAADYIVESVVNG
jgi:vacuolar-type H+-ATPase subunit H